MKMANWMRATAMAAAMAGAAGCATLDEQLGAAPLTADEQLAEAAMQAIRQDGMLSGGAVSVEVFRGTATVSGVVDGNAERVRVLGIVDDMDGIYKVEDRLRVR